VAVDLEVVVDVDLGAQPLGVLVGPGRQGAQGGAIELLEQGLPGPWQLLEGPSVQPGEALGDGGVGLGEAEERAMAERREDPALGLQDTGFDLGLVSRPGWLGLGCGHSLSHMSIRLTTGRIQRYRALSVCAHW
jgi:hypothetical protein